MLIESEDEEVTKPPHYNHCAIECIDYIETSLGPLGFSYYCEGCIKKYMHRFRYKGRQVQDLMKARYYGVKLIKVMQELEDERMGH